jgi:hypothetical protein
VSLVLGLLALPFFFVLVVGVAAVVFGGVALSRINRQGRGGKGMAIAGLVLGAVSLVLGALVLVIVMLGSTDDERAITEARPGDCIDLASQSFESVETYTPRDCDAEHELEVVGIVTAVGTAFPGDDALNALADDRCRQLFAGYVGIDFDDSDLELQPLTPTATSWAKGDHEVACVAVGADGMPLTGSVRGSRR